MFTKVTAFLKSKNFVFPSAISYIEQKSGEIYVHFHNNKTIYVIMKEELK